MTKTLKFAAAALAVVGATAAYASQDDAKPDNAWIAKDVASIHMEPQVIVTAAEIGYVPNSPYSPYSLTLAPAPAPSAVAYSSGSTVQSADSGVLIEQTTVTYYTIEPAPATSPMVDNNSAISAN